MVQFCFKGHMDGGCYWGSDVPEVLFKVWELKVLQRTSNHRDVIQHSSSLRPSRPHECLQFLQNDHHNHTAGFNASVCHCLRGCWVWCREQVEQQNQIDNREARISTLLLYYYHMNYSQKRPYCSTFIFYFYLQQFESPGSAAYIM